METSRGSDLHRACMNGNLRRVQDSVSRIRSKEELQQKLVNPEDSIVGHSPLHEAADRGHHAVLTFLLKCVDSSHAVNCLTSDGSAPMGERWVATPKSVILQWQRDSGSRVHSRTLAAFRVQSNGAADASQ